MLPVSKTTGNLGAPREFGDFPWATFPFEGTNSRYQVRFVQAHVSGRSVVQTD